MKKTSLLFAILPWLAIINFEPVFAQEIIPANDGTATIVTSDGNRITIDGGTLSGDGQNLFHSFQEFGLDANQIATFLSNPQIQNILSRVNGGNPSVINGLIEVVGGNSNLFLMNPAGVVFGQNARLNVPGDFTATTAKGIKFGDTWFNAFGLNDYVNLVGNPNGFQFDGSQAGTIINAGNLAVAEGQNLSLTAGKVVNTGTISAPGGNITLEAVPGTNLVRISQEGQLLSLEVELPKDKEGKALPIQVKDLLDILAGLPPEVKTGLNATSEGKVQLAKSGTTIPDTPGTNIVAGKLDVSNTKTEGVGGEVNVLGDKVGLIGANVDASGDTGGGKVLIGGDYKGQGTVPNADVTVVDSESVINADAKKDGDGGRVIAWADEKTGFYGNISARGGSNSGNGGFVETSGKEDLIFRGEVDVRGQNGNPGSLLLDPANITIVDGDEAINDDQITEDNQILAEESLEQDFTISELALEGLASNANVTVAATNNITINDLTDNNLVFTSGLGGSINFTAGGAFSMNASDQIQATERNINITGATINTGVIDTSAANNGNAGDISLTSTTGDITVNRLRAESLNPNSSSTLGTGRGGQITVNSAGNFQATGFQNDVAGNPESIRTTGQAGSGPINIEATSINILNGGISSFTNSTAVPEPTSLTATTGDIVTGAIVASSLNIASPTALRIQQSYPLGGIPHSIASFGEDISLNVPNIEVLEGTTIEGSILLPQDTIISTNSPANGNVIINGNINSTEEVSRSLGVQGNPTFEGAIGNITPLSSLNVTGTSIINGGAIGTTGDQTYNDAVTLGIATTLTGSNVTFNNTVNATEELEAGLTVNASGTTSFGDRVGETNQLASLTTDASGTTVINTDQINTTGDQTYNDAVTLGTATTLTGSNITFNNTVNATEELEAGLTVNASGNTSFGDRVGETNQLASLTTDASGTTVINTDQINTTGDQTYNDAVTLGTATTLTGSNVTLNAVDFNGVGNSNLTIEAGDNINLNGAIADSEPDEDSLNLTLTGNTNNDNIGIVAINESVNTGGGNIAITNTSVDDVGINIQNPLNSNGGNITLNGTSTNNPGVLIDSNVNANGGNVTITGTSVEDDGVFIGGQVATSGTGTINVTGTSTNDIGIETLGDDQGNNTQVTTTSGEINLTGTSTNSTAISTQTTDITSTDGNLTLTGNEIDLLTGTNITGNTVTLQPQTPELNIAIASTETEISATDLDLTQTELDTIEANLIAIGNTTNGSGTITVANPVTFDDPVTLAIPLGTIQVNGDITGTDDASVSLNSDQTNLNASILTSGNPIDINSNVSLETNVTLSTIQNNQSGANITLDGSVNSIDDNQDLTLAAGTGDINITGAVGDSQLLGDIQVNSSNTNNFGSTVNATSLTINSVGNTQLNGDVTTTGDQIYNNNLQLNTDTQLIADIDGDGSGSVSAGNITASGNNVEIQANNIDVGVINSSSVEGDGGAIALDSDNDINTGTINSSSTQGNGGEITLKANNNINTQGINSSSDNLNGGAIAFDSGSEINTGTINSSSTQGNGGDVTLASQSNIQVDSINAEGGDNGNGGNVNINSDNRQAPLFQATGTFTARNGLDASISTVAGITGGEINLRHGSDGINNPFRVGDPTAPNGTAGVITNGETTIGGESFLFTTKRENINLISVDGSINPNEINGIENPPTQLQAKVSPPTLKVATIEQARETLAKIEQATAEKPALIYVNFTPPGTPLKQDLNEDFARREAASTAQYEQSLNLPENIAEPNLSIPSEDGDVLDLLVVTPDGEPIRIKVDGANRKQMLETANEFYLGFIYDRASYPKEKYLQLGQQLHQWLINPIEAKLKEQKIENLLFVMPTGLRLLPVAALHDGQQFLAQKYSTGMAPSLNLTNTAYQDIREQQLIAMGASQFNDANALGPLPDAEMELNTIAKLWSAGKPSLLNDKFTLDNLQASRKKNPFGIVHIATHGEFAPSENPDEPSEVYLQLFNKRLDLQEWKNMGFNNPPVELLVLSACRTGLGNEDVEMGFAGMAVQAGVKSALGTFWYVSDRGSMALMSEFYHQLKTSKTKITKAEALRRAQAAMIDGKVNVRGEELVTSWGENINLSQNSQLSEQNLLGTEIQSPTLESKPISPPERSQLDFSHPFYWAPFTLIGNPW
jgi:filamentous hemagglutinin family protein